MMKEKYNQIFSRIEAPKDLTFESVMKKTVRERKVIPKYAIGVAACLAVFIVSNIISYAASGEIWVSELWKHTKVVQKHDDSVYLDDVFEYEGNGFSITITRGNPINGMNGSLQLYSETNGVDVIEEDDKVLLVIGNKEIDITDKLNKSRSLYKARGNTKGYACAAGELMIAGQKIVYEIYDLRGDEELRGFGRGFALYEDYVKYWDSTPEDIQDQIIYDKICVIE